MINKRGSTLTNWVFVIVGVLLMVIILQNEVIDPMNSIYGQNFSTGLNTSAFSSFQQLKTTSHNEISGAEVSSTADGLTLTSAWSVGKGVYNTIVAFIDGTFIYNLTSMMDLPIIVAQTLVVLIWLSLILIIIYIFMKVVP
jgi:hypothetical protein